MNGILHAIEATELTSLILHTYFHQVKEYTSCNATCHNYIYYIGSLVN